MKRLKNKTILLLISIFSLFLFILFLIFNISIYQNEYKKLKDKIIRIETMHNRWNLDKNEMKNPMFIDMEVYVVSLDIRGEIKNIMSYTNQELEKEDILKLLKNPKDYEMGKISNLYRNQYIITLNRNHEFVIINNHNVQKYLTSSLMVSFILYLILEIVTVYVSVLLTKWLVKPVIQTFEKQKQFIYDASHELKTPISIIMASADALETEPQEKKWLDNIKSESERMNQLVVNLLELSKLEDMKEKETFQEIDLSKIIENKALSFESLMFEQKLNLDLNIEKNIIFACNVDKIKELLSILIDNAIHHGYEKSKITVHLYKEKNLIYLEVKNRGDSILKEDREKIFERFYRADTARNRDANRYGLGLAIAKNIVNEHKGNIFVNCQNGYTTFTVEFKHN